MYTFLIVLSSKTSMRPSRRTKRKKVEEEEEAAIVEVRSSRSPSTSTHDQSLQQPEEGKLSLGLKLFRRREDDTLTDMTFSLESGSSCVSAHMLIVREGSSTLGEMIKRRRDKNSNNERTEIQVPKEVGTTTFNSFLKVTPLQSFSACATIIETIKLLEFRVP